MDCGVDKLARLHHACYDAASGLDSPLPDEQRFTLATMYARLLELAGAVVVLTRHDGQTALPSVARTMLEVYVDFINLSTDGGYMRFIEAADRRQAQSVLKGLREPGIALLDALASDPEMGPLVASLELSLAASTPQDTKPLSVKDRFETAGMHAAYALVYRQLCSDTHSSRSTLRGSHAERQGDRLEVMFYKEHSIEEVAVYTGLATEMLRESARGIYQQLDCPMPVELSQVLNESES